MDDSQRLFEKLQVLERSFPEIEAEENRAVSDSEIQALVLKLLTAERVLPVNDVRTKELQGEFQKRVKAIQSPREVYRKERAALIKELTGLTRPVIERAVQKFNRMGGDLRVAREILNTKYDGGSKRTILSVKTNEDVVLAFRKKVKEAISKIQGMTLQPIKTIEAEAARFDQELKDFNPDVFVEKKIDELDYYRGSPPPEGIGKDYAGPLSGLRQ